MVMMGIDEWYPVTAAPAPAPLMVAIMEEEEVIMEVLVVLVRVVLHHLPLPPRVG
jgi:hypothetical protein